jgi:phosphate/sulfate permease
MPQMNCFLWIYFPLIGAAIFAFIFSQVASFCIQRSLKVQEERVRKEVREPWDKKRLALKMERNEQKRRERMEIERIEREAQEERDRLEAEY